MSINIFIKFDGGVKMTRKVVDCRDHPSVNNCSLTIAGTEQEVMKAAVRHAVEDHGHKDMPELRNTIKAGMKNE